MALGGRSDLAGQAYQLVIAAESRDQVAPIVASLRAANAKVPLEKRWINDVRSLEDMLPARQEDKLAVLAEIRKLIDDPDLQAIGLGFRQGATREGYGRPMACDRCATTRCRTTSRGRSSSATARAGAS